MRIIKTRTTFGRLTTSLQPPQQKPNLTHTTLFRFTEIPDSQSPIKQCKNYLDTFKQPLQQKTFFDRQPIVSKSVQLPRNASEDDKRYKNYERMLHFSIKKNNVEIAQKKLLKQGPFSNNRLKIINLREMVQKKMISELSSQINFSNNEEKISTIMKDNCQRQQLFQESILIDRLLSVQKQMRKTKDPRNMQPIQYNPRHFHLRQTHRDIHTFYRRKFVKKCNLFNCQSKLAQFQITRFRKKCGQSQVLMNNLMGNYSSHINTDKDENFIAMETIKRIFLHYSIKNGSLEQSYKLMSKSKLYQFFQDFQFKQCVDIINQAIILRDQIDLLDFTEIIFTLNSIVNRAQQISVSAFLKSCIESKQSLYIPKECLQYFKREQLIQNYFKINKLKKKLQIICDLSKIGSNDRNGQKWLNFDSLHELMLTLKIYPSHISKSKMRYYHLFFASVSEVISLEHVMHIIAFISLQHGESFQKVFFQMVDLIKRWHA